MPLPERRRLVVIGFAGLEALPDTLQGAGPFPDVVRARAVSEAFEGLVRDGADLLVVDAGVVSETDLGELKAALRIRPPGALLFAYAPGEDRAASGLRALGGLGMAKPFSYDDLASLAKVARRSADPRSPGRLRAFSARLAVELEALGRQLLQCADDAPGAAPIRAGAREVLDLAERLDAIAGSEGSLPGRKRERLDLRDLLDRCLALLREENPKMRPVLLRGERGIAVLAPAGAMERAIRDLLAFAVSASGGESRVEVSLTATPPRVGLAIQRLSPRLAAAVASTDPFRLDESAGEDGSPFRLALVAGVCDALGWSWTAASGEDGSLRIDLRGTEEAS